MRKFFLPLLAVFFFTAAANADSMSWHTGFSCADMTTAETAKGVYQGAGVCQGVTFNDKGSGMMHEGEGQCFFSFDTVTSTNKGYCAWGDPDGDRIFTSFSGDIGNPNAYDNGINTITGGTGKYEGITGSGPWACNNTLPQGGLVCRQSFNYKLP